MITLDIYFNTSDIHAEGTTALDIVDGRLKFSSCTVVKATMSASRKPNVSLTPYAKETYEKYQALFRVEGDDKILSEPITVRSPNTALWLFGVGYNALESWKLGDGRTLNEYKDDLINCFSDEPSDEQMDDSEQFKVEKEIYLHKNATSCVYAFYYENDRKIAVYEGRNTWEMKIGKASGSAQDRIRQELKTAIPHTPIISRIIYCMDESSMEKCLHNYLKVKGRQVKDSFNGSEWFMTSPSEIDKFIENNDWS